MLCADVMNNLGHSRQALPHILKYANPYTQISSLKLTFSIPEYLEFAQQQTYEMECVVLLLYWYSGEARPTSFCHAAQIFMCTWKTINF
jgi:hypothetical protein